MKNSYVTFAVDKDGKVIGMARLLGDVLNVGEKNFAQFGDYFLIGYFVMSDEDVIDFR